MLQTTQISGSIQHFFCVMMFLKQLWEMLSILKLLWHHRCCFEKWNPTCIPNARICENFMDIGVKILLIVKCYSVCNMDHWKVIKNISHFQHPTQSIFIRSHLCCRAIGCSCKILHSNLLYQLVQFCHSHNRDNQLHLFLHDFTSL